MFKKFMMVFTILIISAMLLSAVDANAQFTGNIVVFANCKNSNKQNYRRQCIDGNLQVEGSMVLFNEHGRPKGIIIGDNGNNITFDFITTTDDVIVINTGQQQAVFNIVGEYLISPTHGGEPIRMRITGHDDQFRKYIR